MNDKLTDLRKEVDKIDENIITLLAKRMEIIKKIGTLKKVHGLVLLDEKRWQDVLSSRITKAQSLTLSAAFVKRIFNLIHEQSLEIEKEI